MALEQEWITNRQIEACRIAITRHVKRGGKVWIRIFPDKPFTKKPAETRMGKGKGNPEYWVAPVKPGTVMFELGGVDRAIAEEAMKRAGSKLPIKTRFLARESGVRVMKDSLQGTDARGAEGEAGGAGEAVRRGLLQRHHRARRQPPLQAHGAAATRPGHHAAARVRAGDPQAAGGVTWTGEADEQQEEPERPGGEQQDGRRPSSRDPGQRTLHPLYKKYLTRTKRLKAHDEKNEAGIGDTVRVVESRPLSRDKRWRLVEILERAK